MPFNQSLYDQWRRVWSRMRTSDIQDQIATAKQRVQDSSDVVEALESILKDREVLPRS